MTAATQSGGILASSQSRAHQFRRQACRTPSVWAAVAFLLVAIFGPLLAPYGPTEITRALPNSPPSAAIWFGTDDNGMDVFSRVIHATRVDLLLPLASAVVSTLVGTLLGLFSGYFRGAVDELLRRIMEILQAFPVVILAMAILLIAGASIVNIILVIALVNVPPYFRTVRAVVAPMASADFVDAARCTGQGDMAIIVRHLLPNVWGPIIAQFTVNFAIAISALAGLSFLGLGIAFPQPEWGLMTKQGADGIIRGIWWVSLFPGLAIFLAVLTLTRLASWLEKSTRTK